MELPKEECCVCLCQIPQDVIVLHEVSSTVRHVVCHECGLKLKEHSGKSIVPCPLCRKEVTIPRLISVWCSLCGEREAVLPEKKALKWAQQKCERVDCRPSPETATCMTCFNMHMLKQEGAACHYCGKEKQQSIWS